MADSDAIALLRANSPGDVAAPRRAVLIFADHLSRDLARRGLPFAAQQLFQSHSRVAGFSGADIHLFTAAHFVQSRSTVHLHRQRRCTFAERLENAIDELSSLGYANIVIIGRDCPNLRRDDVAIAFLRLRNQRLVLGPDHRGGCYLIGFHSADRHLLREVQWKRNTDCAQLRARFSLPDVFLLRVKQDVDSWADLRLLARTADSAARLAAALCELLSAMADTLACFVDLAAQSIRVRGQLPPPLPAS